jgi:tRNA 2-thiouridine synthesizing protein A
MKHDFEVDAKGESCPMPLLRAKQQLNRMSQGQCLRIEATDAGSLRDFRVFADMAGHELFEAHSAPDVFVYFLVKG